MEDWWPLVGRDEELCFVRERLEGSAGRGAVLVGEAGCGKTRLALEVLDQVRATGWSTAVVIAHSATSSIQLGAFAHLLDADDLATDDPLRLLVQARQALERQSAGERLLLVVDDAQHLDPLSAAFLHQEATSAASVLLTLRAHAPVPESVAALWKEGLAERIEIQPLAWPEVQHLLERVLGGRIDGNTMHRLWTASRGNAMYLRELVSGGLTSGVLRRRDGTWSWAGEVVAPRLGDLVASRLTDLPEAERDALRYIALCEPMRAHLLAGLVDDVTLTDLERAGLLTAREEVGTLVIRLAHPLYGEVLRERMQPLDTLATRRRLIEVLGGTQELWPRERINLALWSIELGEPTEPDVLLQASLDATEPAVGLQLARAAADAGGGLRARRVVASYLRILGRGVEAEAVLDALDPPPEDVSEAAYLADIQAENLYYALGRETEALEVLRVAEDLDLSAPARAILALRRASIDLGSGRTEAGLAAASAVLSELTQPDPALVARAGTSCAIALALLGRADEAFAAVDRAVTAADPKDEARWAISMASLVSARYLTGLLIGRLDEAETVARAGYELFAGHPRPDLHGLAALALGRVALGRGQIQTAARRLDEACILLRQQDPGSHLLFALSGLAQAKASGGSASEARAVVTEIARHRRAVRIFDADVALAHAWTTAAAGAPARATALAVEAADIAGRMDHRTFEAIALHDAVRLGAGPEVAERLIGCASSLDGEVSRARYEHARGVVTGDPEPIERASAAFERAGALLLGAECAAHAAHLHIEAGRAQRARAATAGARALAARCEGARTPILSSLGGGTTLTSREREVARLAAQGHSNQEVADRLVVSVRTVENHLHHAYAKLGVSGRDGLAAALGLESVGT